MPRYRSSLPQSTGRLFLTDGGIETSLIFNDGLELPDLAAFHLLETTEGREALVRLSPRRADCVQMRAAVCHALM